MRVLIVMSAVLLWLQIIIYSCYLVFLEKKFILLQHRFKTLTGCLVACHSSVRTFPESPCVNKVSKVITGVLTATNEVGWAGLRLWH